MGRNIDLKGEIFVKTDAQIEKSVLCCVCGYVYQKRLKHKSLICPCCGQRFCGE